MLAQKEIGVDNIFLLRFTKRKVGGGGGWGGGAAASAGTIGGALEQLHSGTLLWLLFVCSSWSCWLFTVSCLKVSSGSLKILK